MCGFDATSNGVPCMLLDHRTIFAIDGDLGCRIITRFDPSFWSSFLVRSPLRCWAKRSRGDAPPGSAPAPSKRRSGRIHRVIHAILMLLHVDFDRAADADHHEAASEPSQIFLKLP